MRTMPSANSIWAPRWYRSTAAWSMPGRGWSKTFLQKYRAANRLPYILWLCGVKRRLERLALAFEETLGHRDGLEFGPRGERAIGHIIELSHCIQSQVEVLEGK